jgi:glutathione peroxidase
MRCLIKAADRGLPRRYSMEIVVSSLYDLSAQDLGGGEQSLADFRGKVLLIVNVASKCGFTPQYEGLETLYRKHKEKGFVVLGFPCNQFGSQEPGGAAEIADFCEKTYHVSFPMFAKIDVNGAEAHPAQRREKRLAGNRSHQMEFH